MSRVWTFVIAKPLSEAEIGQFQHAGETFVAHWTAHDKQLNGRFSIFGKRIVVVEVDESTTEASGCSIDKLTRFMKVSESMFGVELLNRMNVAYRDEGNVAVAPATEIAERLCKGELKPETVIFNTAASTDQELAEWEQPLHKTWLRKYLASA
jgi:hypothetical protein